MHRVLLSIFSAISLTYSYPIPERRCGSLQMSSGQVFTFDPLLNHVQFSLPCPGCDSHTASQSAINDEVPLLFDAYVATQCDDSTLESCHTFTLNNQQLRLASPDQVEVSRSLSLLADDTSGQEHSVTAEIDVKALVKPHRDTSQPTSLSILTASIRLRSADGHGVDDDDRSFVLTFDLSGQQSRVVLTSSATGIMVDLDQATSNCSPSTLDDDTMSAISAEEEFIAAEMEAIRLLEEDVSRLQQEVTSRKDAASVRLAHYHTQVPLDVLMHRCDGIVCTAKAIANRLYEKLTLTLSASNDGYENIQASGNSSAADSRHRRPANSTRPESTFTALSHGPTDFLLKALAYVASLLGLAALFAYIRNRCMSIRKRTERAADLEERRTARAYRRAARREKIRRRWSAFTNLFSFCKCKAAPPVTRDYDEKRAIILQEALLEQNPEILEKGDIMEAEIRQLRHARSITSEIERRNLDKHDLAELVKDPPPALVPLPYSSSRSRSSTNTLPSYDSASLPDYSSLPDQPESEIYVSNGFAGYSPPASDDGLIEHDNHGTNLYSGRTYRSTPISSVAGLSPRVSAETLRTRTTVRSRAASRDMP